MSAHSKSLAWRIPWTEEPGGGLKKSGTTEVTEFAHIYVFKNLFIIYTENHVFMPMFPITIDQQSVYSSFLSSYNCEKLFLFYFFFEKLFLMYSLIIRILCIYNLYSIISAASTSPCTDAIVSSVQAPLPYLESTPTHFPT